MPAARSPLRLLPILLAAVVMFVSGCGSDESTADSPSSTVGGSSTTARPVLAGSITVSGATSLKAAFAQIADKFTDVNPGVEVAFNFESSATLATQILEGAPADVFASADEANMTKLTDKSLVAGEPEIFARNDLVIVTKPGNPGRITTLADLADAGVVSLCGEEVPCGKYAKQVLTHACITLDESNVTRGQNVGATLTAVAQGDAVAGIVYSTDAVSAGATVDAVSIPADVNVIATYPIGALAASGNAEVADAFVAYVLGDEGRAVLTGLGFLPPA